MSYLVLARKWRPQSFDQILGQEATVQTLQNAIRQNRVAHAFLFSGPRGVGKTSLARILAKAINCQAQDGPTTNPCGICGPCREITAGSAMDVQEIDGASNNGIDDIRELREKVRYMPAACRTKIYIIDEVHMLSPPAFNALLKTLEEPPPNVVFIFATTEQQKIPATILSRCQRYDFHRVSGPVLAAHLARLCEKEGIELPEGSLRVIAREAEGSVRDALSLLDQVASFGGKGLLEDDVLRILGVVDRNLVAAIARCLLAGDAAGAIDALVRSDEAGNDIKQLSRALLRWFRNLAVIKVARAPEKAMDVSDGELAELRAMAEDRNLETIERHFDQFIRLDEELRDSGQPRLLLEMTLVRMATTPPLETIAELIARLEDMEKNLRAGRALNPQPAMESAPLFTGQPEPATPPAPCGSEPTWPDFLALVKDKDFKLYSFLTAGSFAGRSGREWRLAFAPGNFTLERLRGQPEAQRLHELMAECFGEGHRLVISEDPALARPERVSPLKEDENRRREAMQDPVVQSLLDDLQGEIEMVKTR